MGERRKTRAAGIVGMGVGLLMVVSALGLTGAAAVHGASQRLTLAPIAATPDPTIPSPQNYSYTLNNTPINGTSNLLNNTTAHPWGETYSSVTHCLYVTEDPMTPATMGYVTVLGPSYATLSYPIWGGDNPEGIAWAARYAGEPTAWTAKYTGGILEVADSQSSAISVFGIWDVSTTLTCGALRLLQTDLLPNYVTGGLLVEPFDVVFAASSGLFYTTWYASSMVTATAGSNLICETNTNLVEPTGLSYGLVNGKPAIAVANFQANGWVTAFYGLAASNPCGISTMSLAELDRSEWTVFAPKLMGTSTSGVVNHTSVIAVSDANYGIGSNLYGSGCTLGLPLSHVMAELKPAVGLGCSNSVALDTSLPPNPGALGITYSTYTTLVYEVLSAAAQLCAVTYNHVAVCVPTLGSKSIEVIWFVPPAATVGSPPTPPPSPTPYYNTPAGDGTLVVTDWGSGNLFFSNAF